MNRPNISTLIGNGFLPDPPPQKNWPREWDVRGRNLLRKCMLLPMPPHMQAMVAAQPESMRNPSPLPPLPTKRDVHIPEPRRAPERFARVFPAVAEPSRLVDTGARARAALLEREKEKLLERHPALPRQASPASPARWFEDPVVIGTLLLLTPPIGLAALWSSRRYSTDARWALTVMTGLTMCIGAALAITVMVVRN